MSWYLHPKRYFQGTPTWVALAIVIVSALGAALYWHAHP